MWSFNEFKMALAVPVRENRGILRCLVLSQFSICICNYCISKAPELPYTFSGRQNHNKSKMFWNLKGFFKVVCLFIHSDLTSKGNFSLSELFVSSSSVTGSYPVPPGTRIFLSIRFSQNLHLISCCCCFSVNFCNDNNNNNFIYLLNLHTCR